MGKQFAVFITSTPKKDVNKENVPPPNSPMSIRALSNKKRTPLTDLTKKPDEEGEKSEKTFVFLNVSFCGYKW